MCTLSGEDSGSGSATRATVGALATGAAADPLDGAVPAGAEGSRAAGGAGAAHAAASPASSASRPTARPARPPDRADHQQLRRGIDSLSSVEIYEAALW